MKLILTGMQGAGKSTQGNVLSRQLDIPYLSTGHIFREIAKEKTKRGRYVKELINSGSLVPDENAVAIVKEYLGGPTYKEGYILDGFPRTIKQVELFDVDIDNVIYIEIPDKEALWRLAYRDDTKRDDDTIKAIKRRLELFHEKTEPVIEHYKKQEKLININGMQDIKDVNKEILRNLGIQIVANQVRTWKARKHTIIALVALPGAGKSEAARFFMEKEIPVVSLGRAINAYVDKQGLEHTETVHKKVRKDFRDKHGMAAMAILNKDKIASVLSEGTVVVIDGMRSWEEYLYLRKEFAHARVLIVSIYAEKRLRYKRVSRRADRAKLYGEERDIDELIGTNMGPTIAFADYMVVNDGSKEQFVESLEQVYRNIYFSL